MRYWKFTNLDGSTKSVLSCSNDAHAVPDAVEVDKAEFDSFIASLPEVTPEPPRDAFAEIDKLEARVKELEKK